MELFRGYGGLLCNSNGVNKTKRLARERNLKVIVVRGLDTKFAQAIRDNFYSACHSRNTFLRLSPYCFSIPVAVPVKWCMRFGYGMSQIGSARVVCRQVLVFGSACVNFKTRKKF